MTLYAETSTAVAPVIESWPYSDTSWLSFNVRP